MTSLYGQTSRAGVLMRVGDMDQVCSIRRMTLAEGNEEGVRIADVRTGSGLRVQVTLDRGMDLSMAEYRGIPLTFRSPNGDVHPRQYDPHGGSYAAAFAGGLMALCGLQNVGWPGMDDGEELPQHGIISQQQATEVRVERRWEGNDHTMTLHGTVREPVRGGGALVLHRAIESSSGRRSIVLRDEVVNESGQRRPLMILYHHNLGWPLLDEGAQLLTNGRSVRPRDDQAARGIADACRFSAPVEGVDEEVFYHDLQADSQGMATVLLANARLALGVYVRYRQRELPQCVEWKMMRAGTYVVGVEPANCHVEGRAAERASGTLQFLEPGERRAFLLEIGVVDGTEQIDNFAEANGLR